ncbi:hypothetical protein [Rhodococcus sp. NPDC127528]|uniref:hypothetical protein n=1 Tax=unclassified Rhodococcus (in: high G+C Gram-positive bacteria) TaxID=192944 RepID=UPI00363CD147
MNSTALASLIVGLVAAFATVVVALIAARNTGRDTRENLRRDAELAQKLADDSLAKRVLERHIHDQIIKVAVRDDLRAPRILQLVMFAIAEGALVANLIWIIVTEPDSRRYGLTEVTVFACVAFAFASYQLRRTRIARKKEVLKQAMTDLPTRPAA